MGQFFSQQATEYIDIIFDIFVTKYGSNLSDPKILKKLCENNSIKYKFSDPRGFFNNDVVVKVKRKNRDISISPCLCHEDHTGPEKPILILYFYFDTISEFDNNLQHLTNTNLPKCTKFLESLNSVFSSKSELDKYKKINYNFQKYCSGKIADQYCDHFSEFDMNIEKEYTNLILQIKFSTNYKS